MISFQSLNLKERTLVALDEKQRKYYEHLTTDYENALLATSKQLLPTIVNPDAIDFERLNADLALKFLLDHHHKYINFLNFLHDRKEAVCLLEFLLTKLTKDPQENLQLFIEEVQSIMDSDDFKEEINTFYKNCEDKIILYEGVGAVSVVWLLISAFFVLASPWVLFITIPVLLVCVFCYSESRLKKESLDFFKKQFPDYLNALEIDIEDYGLSYQFSHKLEGNKSQGVDSITTIIKTTTVPCKTSELRERFFKSTPDTANTLNQLVQENFNHLPKS